MSKRNTSKNNNSKKNNIRVNNLSVSDGFSNGFKIVICVLVMLGIFYLLTLYILNKKVPYSLENNAEIQYVEILAGETFDQKSNDYFVLFYDKVSDNTNNYSNIVTNYNNRTDKKDMFIVNLSEGLNKKFISSSDDNDDVTDISNLKVNGPTLIHIVDGKVEHYITENIEEFLNNY